jgi:hypothetical protein
MNIDKMKKRLGEISNKNRKSNLLWKPSNGTNEVRIVPYKFQPEEPFVELKFHYDFNGKTYLSPSSFDRPDPIVELANQLKRDGDQDKYKLGISMMPKLRIFAPVIVRGEESQGVRFWGFGKQVYQQLLGIVADDEYGDISDIKAGTDITVVYIPKEETGKNFPETQIRPKRKSSVVGDDSVITSIKSQVAITEVYEEPTYDALKEALSAYLSDGEEEEADETEVKSDASTTESEAAPKGKSTEEAAGSFDTLFNS